MENLLNSIKEWLDFDPVDEAEKICQEHPEGSAGLGMILNMQKNAVLKAVLEGVDTYFGISFSDTQEVLKSIGFVLEYQETFKDHKQIETLEIYVHEKYTAFALIESFDEKFLNRCEVNCLLRRPTEEEYEKFFGFHCSHEALDDYDRETKTTIKKQEISAHFDGREALKIKLSEMKEFLLEKPIPRKPFLWLLNYTEKNKIKERLNQYDEWYDKISMKKLKKCKSVKRIIGWEEKSFLEKIKDKFRKTFKWH